MKRILTAVSFTLALGGFGIAPAKADLKLCNNTGSEVQVAVGYKDKDGWASEGWWKAPPSACIKIYKGPLIARYYYVYATDKDKGGEWAGKPLFCVKDKIFTIRGIDNCVGRGFQQKGFFEVDTGEAMDKTVSLTDPGAKPGTAPAPAPAIAPPPAQ